MIVAIPTKVAPIINGTGNKFPPFLVASVTFKVC